MSSGRDYMMDRKDKQMKELMDMCWRPVLTADKRYLGDSFNYEKFYTLVTDRAKAEEREACAKVCEQGTGEAVQKATLEILLNERKRIAKAIRDRGYE